MNGVMADSVSEGSSHRGASVTWAAKIIWPSAARAGRSGVTVRTARAKQQDAIVRAPLIMPTLSRALPGRQGCSVLASGHEIWTVLPGAGARRDLPRRAVRGEVRADRARRPARPRRLV